MVADQTDQTRDSLEDQEPRDPDSGAAPGVQRRHGAESDEGLEGGGHSDGSTLFRVPEYRFFGGFEGKPEETNAILGGPLENDRPKLAGGRGLVGWGGGAGLLTHSACVALGKIWMPLSLKSRKDSFLRLGENQKEDEIPAFWPPYSWPG